MILPLLALALSPETLLDWRPRSQPQIPPDGRRIVYTLETADRFHDRFENTLWMVSVNGKDHRPIGAGRQQACLAQAVPALGPLDGHRPRNARHQRRHPARRPNADHELFPDNI
jgi:hypothetical protein